MRRSLFKEREQKDPTEDSTKRVEDESVEKRDESKCILIILLYLTLRIIRKKGKDYDFHQNRKSRIFMKKITNYK